MFGSNADGEWSIEAAQAIVELTQFRTLQAQIAGYTETGMPEIHLYSFLGPNVSRAMLSSHFIYFSFSFSLTFKPFPSDLLKLFTQIGHQTVSVTKCHLVRSSSIFSQNVVFINQELVARNYAEWCEPVASA